MGFETTVVDPGRERGRIAALQRYGILDTPPDGAFDRITALVSDLLDVPISIISLVDVDRIWFKSCLGLDATEVGRDLGLCASAILRDGPYLVADAAADPRTLANPLVAGELGFRFYAGVPLRTRDGHNLGVLTAIDREPRTIGDREVRILEDLAQVVMDQMELRLAAREVDRLHLELQRSHEALQEKARRDGLTRLSNRDAILAHLERVRAAALRDGAPLAVAIVDVDRFKEINDARGHLGGDAVLREVARRMATVTRESDAVGRLGGDEFLIVMYPCAPEVAEAGAERLRAVVAERPVDVDGAPWNVTLSVGVHATRLDPDTDVQALLRKADVALYRAKAQGRDRAVLAEASSD